MEVVTLLGTNISHFTGTFEDDKVFPFPQEDILVPWKVPVNRTHTPIQHNTPVECDNFTTSALAESVYLWSFVHAKAIKPPHKFFQGKGEGAAEDLAANQWTQQMGYQCISY